MASGVTESGRVVRIGGASGALNDSVIAVPQLLRVPDLNYLAFDYLGEGAMGIFARLKQMDPAIAASMPYPQMYGHFVERGGLPKE